MEYTVRNTSFTTTEVLLTGRLTFTDNDPFLDMMKVFEGHTREHRFVLDLSGLEFIDSSGLGMFLVARDTAVKNDYELVLRGAHKQVKKVLDIAKFGTVFQVSGDLYALWLAGRANPADL